MENQTVNLHPYGDTELWYAGGDDWSLPLHVQWHRDLESDRHYGLVMPAVGLYYSQGLRLVSMLQAHDIQGRQDRWMVPRKMVEAILHKAPGITTLAYYKWNEPNCPAIPIPGVVKVNKITGDATTELATQTSDRSNQDSFLTFVSERTGLGKNILRVAFKAICDHAPAWMVEKRGVINFGTFKVFAAPFRANWKEIVSCKFKRRKLLEIFSDPNGEKYERLEEAGMPGALCSMHNIALRKTPAGHMVSYTIEAVATKRFENVVGVSERSRIACGSTSHVASFEKTVEALYHHLLDALESYLHKVSLPFARIYESRNGGRIGFAPTTSSKISIRGVPIRHLPVHIIPPLSNFTITDGESDSLVVPLPPPGVPEMPDLLQNNEDVRGRQIKPDVDNEGGREGASGLPLLVADKGTTEGQPVLSG